MGLVDFNTKSVCGSTLPCALGPSLPFPSLIADVPSWRPGTAYGLDQRTYDCQGHLRFVGSGFDIERSPRERISYSARRFDRDAGTD